MSTSWYFFFRDVATTEIYTYCHTLSLHDALPISSWSCSVRKRCRRRSPASARSPPTPPAPTASRSTSRPASTPSPASSPPSPTGRSEEHPSALQSLMRLPYAVFCLQNKKTEVKRHTSD